MCSSLDWRIPSTHLGPTEGSSVCKKGICTRRGGMWPRAGSAAGAGPVALTVPKLTPSNSPYSSNIPLHPGGYPYWDNGDRAPLQHRPVFLEADLLADGDRPFSMFGVLDADGSVGVVHRPLRFRIGPGHLLLDAIEERFDIPTFLTVIDLE